MWRNLWPLHSYLSLELICNALASILAPMSPIAFPLMSSLVSVELLPKALRTMVRSLLSLESARDREVRGWEGEDLTGTKGVWGQERVKMIRVGTYYEYKGRNTFKITNTGQ